MAYIGNQVTSVPFITDTFSGNNSATSFGPLTRAPAGSASIAVYISGVYKTPGSEYTVSGTQITFAVAPASGTNNIVVLHLGSGSVTQVPSDGSVTAQKMAPDSVTSSALADAAVTTTKIAASGTFTFPNINVTGNSIFATQSPGDNTTNAATTSFVTSAIDAKNLGTISTQNANNVTLTGGNVTGMTTIADTAGDLRSIPIQNKITSYTITSTDSGKVISITTGNVTVPNSIFSANQTVSIYNNSNTTRNVVNAGGVTIILAGSGLTGTRNLSGYGLCTLICISSNTFVITGAGVS